jgi:spermidine synthase
VLAACLVFSGLCALVYQIVWTRLLGLAFGTTTEAIASVLGIFFGGLALGNWIAARRVARLARPLRAYAALEACVGAWALLSLPVLQHLDDCYAWLGVPETAWGLTLLRVGVAALLLLPPTVAMGATLPVVARGLVARDETLGRSSAWLYAANTAGAVLGAYSCGFWWIPALGLARTVLAAAAINLAVAALAFGVGRGLRAVPAPAPVSEGPGPSGSTRTAFLFFFAVSGFVAIGYEIVWSKIFGIVMEGTLYGFASVLSAVLLGIAVGSAAIAGRVDSLRDPGRAFALVHVAIGAAVVLGMAAVPYLPWAYERVARVAPAGDAVHLLSLLVLPIVLLPMALFGVAFPILIRIHAQGAHAAARGIGIATAVNTAGSIAASFCVGFWWIPVWGTDATLYALLLLDLGVALAALVGFQRARGFARLASTFGALAVVCTVMLAYGGVRIEEAIAGRQLKTVQLSDYVSGLRRAASERVLTIEGRTSVVTVYANRQARLLRTNGMPEAGVHLAPPYLPYETVSLAVWPYALAADPQRALVIGLGGANTLDALLASDVREVEVVELERAVVQAAALLHQGLPDPLADPRVALRIDDGRNHLLRASRSGAPGYDLISSQPSHPWRVGAANLFTEDFFRIARASLREGGVFAAWLNGFRIDADAFLAVVASFERVFPGALLVDASERDGQSFLLLGSREPIAIDAPRFAARLAEPRLASLLGAYGIRGPAELLARVEGPARVFAALAKDASNTDDNAYVETRAPRALLWGILDFGAIEARLPADAPLLPEVQGAWSPLDVARALLAQGPREGWPFGRRLDRLLAQHGAALAPRALELVRAEAALRDPQRASQAEGALRELADAQPGSPEPWRLLGTHLALDRSAWRDAAEAFARAFARSGAPSDAYDAGRALFRADPAGAQAWFARIPQAARPDFPRLAYYDATAALARGLRGDALAPYAAALDRFLASDEGRRFPGAQELASRVSWARGDALGARRHADADAQQRAEQARPWLERAAKALAANRTDDARAALDAASQLTPGDSQLLWMRAELAFAHGAPGELEHALAALRDGAPSDAEARGLENAFRSEHGLPLAPATAPRDATPACDACGPALPPRSDVG